MTSATGSKKARTQSSRRCAIPKGQPGFSQADSWFERMVTFNNSRPIRTGESAIGTARRYALARDALLHAPIIVGLLFLLLPRYDFRFPISWPFQPKFVVLAIVTLLGVRFFHFVPHGRITANLSARIRQLKNTMSAEALPYLLPPIIIGLGFAFRYHDSGV